MKTFETWLKEARLKSLNFVTVNDTTTIKALSNRSVKVTVGGKGGAYLSIIPSKKIGSTTAFHIFLRTKAFEKQSLASSVSGNMKFVDELKLLNNVYGKTPDTVIALEV